jgi:glycosyltransferase involved in cell wall biosynthesis
VISQDFQDWEAIIINDGSTDTTEEIALQWLEKDQRFKYFAKLNEGLGKTRNYGISQSIGIYILPLDSDNQLIYDFTKDAIAVLEKNQDVGVVYGHAEYFGEKNGLWKIDEYNFKKILAGNYIDACAIFRKKLWIDVGGYEENMPYQGHEDWEFWIAFGILNTKFYHLNKITFKYFVSKSSMIRSFNKMMVDSNYGYISNKYSAEYQKFYRDIYVLFEKNEKQYMTNLKSEKFVINLFTKMFLGFEFFKLKL